METNVQAVHGFGWIELQTSVDLGISFTRLIEVFHNV